MNVDGHKSMLITGWKCLAMQIISVIHIISYNFLSSILDQKGWGANERKGGEDFYSVYPPPSESVFLDEGQGASGGVSYFANFFINLDQYKKRKLLMCKLFVGKKFRK